MRFATPAFDPIRTHPRLLGRSRNDVSDRASGHPVRLSRRKERLAVFPDAILIPAELPASLVSEVKVGGTGITLLDLAGEIELAGFGVEVEIRPVERDEFTDTETSICEKDDEGLIAIL
jgi:hypothetical protein